MLRTPSARRPVHCTGQSIYEVMLIIACVAMALALFFAAHEYLSFYHGPSAIEYKFEPTATVPPLPKPAPRTPAPAAPAPVATPAPVTTAAPAAAPTASSGTTTAPATTTP